VSWGAHIRAIISTLMPSHTKNSSPRRPCGSANGQSLTCVKGKPDGETPPRGENGKMGGGQKHTCDLSKKNIPRERSKLNDLEIILLLDHMLN